MADGLGAHRPALLADRQSKGVDECVLGTDLATGST
jgi:hypothetical protein